MVNYKRSKAAILLFLVFFIGANCAFSQSRSSTTGRQLTGFNNNWSFTKDPDGKGTIENLNGLIWQKIALPHTWNAKDVMDDDPGYYRGTGWYKKVFLTPNAKAKSVFLCFEGANQETEVYINGKLAGTHIGGYTGFTFRIDSLLKFTGDLKNELIVKVDNRFNDNVPPLTADFTFYGGIYRNVNLLITDQVHFSNQSGSNGVYITTPSVSEQQASVNVKCQLENSSGSVRNLLLNTSVYDLNGKEISSGHTVVKLQPKENKSFTQGLSPVNKPNLWSPEHPYLYKVITKLTDPETKETIDQVSNTLGFRWFKFDAANGFFLNGKPLKLIGASRHQDYEGLGNAVPNDLQIHDIELLKAMGGNFLRIAHYPQNQVILQTCDRLGILASVEIPVVNAITEHKEFTDNCKNMQIEMIRQNFNHPSVVIWGYMNEVLLRPKFSNDKSRQEIYYGHIRDLAQTLDDLTRKEDPSRYTMIACHGDFNRYSAVGLTKIPMIVGWNLYQGWYGGNFPDFASFLDKHHQQLADKPLLVTEYGADADPRIRSFTPVRFDKSVEYALKLHQAYLNAILKRPFVSGVMAWNLADFNSEAREETMPHINNKGLLTFSRQPKDTYYLYQAYLLKEPFIKIASTAWKFRTGIADSGSVVSTQKLQVATNLKELELFLNGKSLGIQASSDHICEWSVPFASGQNTLRAADPHHPTFGDQMTINFTLLPFRFSHENYFSGFNIMLGANRYFIDKQDKQLWIPDQPYKKGSWGYIGGQAFKGSNNRITYGSDKNIINTAIDPVYQTQQVDIQQYKIDVPDGDYELDLCFAELTGGEEKEALAYNLDNKQTTEKQEQRVFDVEVNDRLFLKNFNIAEQYGYATAVTERTRVTVTNDRGITLHFIPVKGKPVLNALQLRKIN